MSHSLGPCVYPPSSQQNPSERRDGRKLSLQREPLLVMLSFRGIGGSRGPLLRFSCSSVPLVRFSSTLMRPPRPRLLRFCSTQAGGLDAPDSAALDSLTMLRKLENGGLCATSSEAVTTAVLDAVRASSKADSARYATIEASARETLVMNSELERLRSEIATLRAELKASKEKQSADLRYEVDKLQASQRLDLNLEKGRIREDLQKQSDTYTKADARIDKELNQIRTMIEASKSELLRYSIGTLVSFVAVSAAVVRMLI